MCKNVVYVLIDPLTGNNRYVGCTTRSTGVRLTQHLKDHKLTTHKGNWLSKLRKSGNRPILKVIQEYNTKEEMLVGEIWWIRYFRKKGRSLTNLTDGGEGFFGRTHSDESRKKMSEGVRRAQTKEVRKKMSDAKIGLPSKKRIKIIDDLGNIFVSMKMAAKYYKIEVSAVHYGIKRRRQVVGISFKLYAPGDAACLKYETRNSKEIICDDTGKRYLSIREASRELKLDPGDIGKVCKGTKPHCGGLTFSFVHKGGYFAVNA